MSDARGISYYIPPELKEKGKQIYNLLSAVDPVQGIMRGMSASGRAADSDLSPEQRRSALIEAGVETASPLMMMGLGALAKQPVKATLMDVLAPTGATKDIAEDALADPSRRNFLGGIAAAVPVAALAPDVITDVVAKAAKTGSRAAINPLDMAMANIRALKDQIDEKYQILDEIESSPDAANLNAKAADDADAFIFRSQDEIVDEAINILEDMTPSDLKGASDEAIEEIVSIQYDPMNGQFFDFGSLEADNLPLNPKYKMLSDEIQRRGLDKAKDRNGIDRFTHARAFVEDVNDKLNEGITFSSPNPSMQMVRETPADIDEDILELKLTELRRQIAQADRVMRVDGKTTKEIDDFKAQKRREMYELQGLPPDMDDFYANGGPVISGVGSLNQTARDMFRGPRGIGAYQQFTEGGVATSSDFLNALMEQSAQAKAKREEKNKAIALAEQREKFADEEEVMNQPLDNSLASTYARAAKMGEDEFMVGVAPTNINPMYQLAMKGDPSGIFGVLPPRDKPITFNTPKIGSVELSGYDNRSLKDVAAGNQRFLTAEAIPDFKDREELRSMLSFFAEDLTDEERQQLKRPVLADSMMATKEILAHEAGHLYDDEFFEKNMDVVYPLYEELLDGRGREYGDGFVGEFLQELFEPIEGSEQFTEMGVTDNMRQAAQDYLRRGALDTDVLSPATIGVLSRLKRLMNEDSKLTTALRPRPRPSQLN